MLVQFSKDKTSPLWGGGHTIPWYGFVSAEQVYVYSPLPETTDIIQKQNWNREISMLRKFRVKHGFATSSFYVASFNGFVYFMFVGSEFLSDAIVSTEEAHDSLVRWDSYENFNLTADHSFQSISGKDNFSSL